ncbi:tyrosine-type recombinase/integrase [Oceanobacillus kimchii]|uniref:tyrosine-type recombinase/integrase n=1 Tax=Oceanobacillus kimchii TaxID=746691 RepID=UPI0021A269FD|nr:site-specific integrase [Oceanobacillus kimchii]MCT1575654.1 tyrosine-type recombinase/integrase [Oceanobacillus kimchii]MCT2137285.1 tyrosine-type recombinase/integrase [Oceanobacillus kimchii]
MASFQKRGKTWQYTISSKPKPIRKGGFKTKKEAQVAASVVEEKMRKGFSPIAKEESLTDYYESWLSTFKTDISKNTMTRYLNTLETLKNYFMDKPIQKINKREYQIFINEYAKNHAKATVRKLNTHIRACVKEAIDEGLIVVDFTRDVSISGLNGKKKTEKYLDYQDSQRLIKELYKRIDKSKAVSYYAILLGLTTGLRFGEMVGLKRKDFNFEESTINVDKTWGYTNKMHEGWGPTKNEQSVRVIKVDKRTMKLFESYFERTPENFKKLVFYSPSSKYQVVSNGAVNKSLRLLLEDLSIRTVSIHSMRHTHASILLYQGVSVYYVSKRLGHGDLETTINTYSHVLKELEERDQEKSVNIFDTMAV